MNFQFSCHSLGTGCTFIAAGGDGFRYNPSTSADSMKNPFMVLIFSVDERTEESLVRPGKFPLSSFGFCLSDLIMCHWLAFFQVLGC